MALVAGGDTSLKLAVGRGPQRGVPTEVAPGLVPQRWVTGGPQPKTCWALEWGWGGGWGVCGCVSSCHPLPWGHSSCWWPQDPPSPHPPPQQTPKTRFLAISFFDLFYSSFFIIFWEKGARGGSSLPPSPPPIHNRVGRWGGEGRCVLLHFLFFFPFFPPFLLRYQLALGGQGAWGAWPGFPSEN